MNLQNVTHLVHAYKVAPWRVQLQWIGNALLGVVALAMVATLYLDVTAQAGIAGREIQELNASIITSQQISADLQTELASMTATSVMEERARELGYRPVEPAEIEYLVVPGYIEPRPSVFAAAPLPQMSAPTVPPEYTQSLLIWLDEQIALSGKGVR